MRYRALVTGASAGLGAEFARQLASLGVDLVLVARSARRLEALAAELRPRVRVEVLVADLTDAEQLDRVARRLERKDAPIDILVSNAGFGVAEAFHASRLDDERRMLELLTWVPLRLAHAALPGMRARGRGWILTVASAAALLPNGSYAAAKAHAVSLSRSIRARYGTEGIRATALLPGMVATEFHHRMGVTPDAVPAFAWADARTVVRDGIRGLRRGKARVISDWRYRLAAPFVPLIPDRALGGLGLSRGVAQDAGAQRTGVRGGSRGE